MFHKQLDTKEGRVGKGPYHTMDLDQLVRKTGVPVEIVIKVIHFLMPTTTCVPAVPS